MRLMRQYWLLVLLSVLAVPSALAQAVPSLPEPVRQVFQWLFIDLTGREGTEIFIFTMRFLYFLIIFTVIWIGLERAFSRGDDAERKKHRRPVILIAFTIALSASLLTPNQVITTIWQAYAFVLSIAAALVPMLAGVWLARVAKGDDAAHAITRGIIYFIIAYVYFTLLYNLTLAGDQYLSFYKWAIWGVILAIIFGFLNLLSALTGGIPGLPNVAGGGISRGEMLPEEREAEAVGRRRIARQRGDIEEDKLADYDARRSAGLPPRKNRWNPFNWIPLLRQDEALPGVHVPWYKRPWVTPSTAPPGAAPPAVSPEAQAVMDAETEALERDDEEIEGEEASELKRIKELDDLERRAGADIALMTDDLLKVIAAIDKYWTEPGADKVIKASLEKIQHEEKELEAALTQLLIKAKDMEAWEAHLKDRFKKFYDKLLAWYRTQARLFKGTVRKKAPHERAVAYVEKMEKDCDAAIAEHRAALDQLLAQSTVKLGAYLNAFNRAVLDVEQKDDPRIIQGHIRSAINKLSELDTLIKQSRAIARDAGKKHLEIGKALRRKVETELKRAKRQAKRKK